MTKQNQTYWYESLHRTYSHEWSADTVLFKYDVDKMLERIRKEYPNTPFTVDSGGNLVFIYDNDEYCDEIAALYNLLLLRLQCKHEQT